MQIALGVKSPKEFLKWLEEKDEEILGEMPNNAKNFKGVNITRFLLQEASQDTLERLLNVRYCFSAQVKRF